MRRFFMMEIKVLGTGCAKCERLAENAEAAAKELGLEYTVEKVTDGDAIIEAGVVITPALMVNGEIKSSGKVLGIDQLKRIIG